jgi:hypothetical protein
LARTPACCKMRLASFNVPAPARLLSGSDLGLRVPALAHLRAFCVLGVTRLYVFGGAQHYQPSRILAWFFFPVVRHRATGPYESGHTDSGLTWSRSRMRVSARRLARQHAFTVKPGYISLWVRYREILNIRLMRRFRRHFRLSKWVARASRSSMFRDLAPIEANVGLTVWGCPRELAPLATTANRPFIGYANWTYNWNYALY